MSKNRSVSDFRHKKARPPEKDGVDRHSPFLQLWVDGSFKDTFEEKYAGGAVVRRDGRSDRVIDVMAFCFARQANANAAAGVSVKTSVEAELMAITRALEACAPRTVNHLVCDCIVAVARLTDIKRDRLNAGKYNGPMYDRLITAVKNQPSMDVQWLRRNSGSIPMADAFASAAARGDILKMEAVSRRFRVPFVYVSDLGVSHRHNPAAAALQ